MQQLAERIREEMNRIGGQQHVSHKNSQKDGT